MNLDRDLQRAGARYTNAKANETYFNMALVIGLIVGIGVIAFRLIDSSRQVFGM